MIFSILTCIQWVFYVLNTRSQRLGQLCIKIMLKILNAHWQLTKNAKIHDTNTNSQNKHKNKTQRQKCKDTNTNPHRHKDKNADTNTKTHKDIQRKNPTNTQTHKHIDMNLLKFFFANLMCLNMFFFLHYFTRALRL